jgi:hypothetical protein
MYIESFMALEQVIEVYPGRQVSLFGVGRMALAGGYIFGSLMKDEKQFCVGE